MKVTVFCAGRAGSPHERIDLRTFGHIFTGKRYVTIPQAADQRLDGQRIDPNTDFERIEEWVEQGRSVYDRPTLACPACGLNLTGRQIGAVADFAGQGVSEVPLSVLMAYIRTRR